MKFAIESLFMNLSWYLSTWVTFDCMHFDGCLNAGHYLTYKKYMQRLFLCELWITQKPSVGDYFSLVFEQGMELKTNFLHSV